MKIPQLKVEGSPDYAIPVMEEQIENESVHEEALHNDLRQETRFDGINPESLYLVDDPTTGEAVHGIRLASAHEERVNGINFDPETYVGGLIESGQLGRENVAKTLVGSESITKDTSPIVGINTPEMKDNDNIALSINSLLGQIATSAGLNPGTDLIKNQAAQPQNKHQPMLGGSGRSLFSRVAKPEVSISTEKDIKFQLHRASDLLQNHGEKIAQAAENNPDLKGKLESLSKNIEQAGKNDKTISEAIKSLGEAMGKLFEKMLSKLSKSDKGPSPD